MRRKASDKTIRSCRQPARRLAARGREERGAGFDETGLSDLSRDAACALLVWPGDGRGLSPQTPSLRLSATEAFLRFCGEEDAGLAGPCLSVSSARPSRGASSPGTEHLEPVQSGEPLSEPDVSTRVGRRDRFLMTLAHESGTRTQELLDLTCDRVGECGGYVTPGAHGKGGKARIVPLASQAAGHLDAHVAESRPGTVDHLPRKYAASTRARDPSFPEGLHAHTLRHGIATAMYRAGSPIPYTRDFLGHADPSTTMACAHADGGAIASAVEAASRQVATPVTPAEKRWKGREQYLLELCGLA